MEDEKPLKAKYDTLRYIEVCVGGKRNTTSHLTLDSLQKTVGERGERVDGGRV